MINWLSQLIEQNYFRENDCCPASQNYLLFIETEVTMFKNDLYCVALVPSIIHYTP
jgi:hypothetical protein